MMFTIEKILGDKLGTERTSTAESHRPQKHGENNTTMEEEARATATESPLRSRAPQPITPSRKSLSDGEDEISGGQVYCSRKI